MLRGARNVRSWPFAAVNSIAVSLLCGSAGSAGRKQQYRRARLTWLIRGKAPDLLENHAGMGGDESDTGSKYHGSYPV